MEDIGDDRGEGDTEKVDAPVSVAVPAERLRTCRDCDGEDGATEKTEVVVAMSISSLGRWGASTSIVCRKGQK